MLSGVGSPVWYYMVLSWLDLVYVLFPFIHFARSLIISVNRRHFNDLCFVFGFSAFFSILFIFHYIWGISGLGVWPFVCHLHAKLRLSLYLFYFHSRYFSSCPHPRPHIIIIVPTDILGLKFRTAFVRYQRPVIFNKHRCPLSWISFH